MVRLFNKTHFGPNLCLVLMSKSYFSIKKMFGKSSVPLGTSFPGTLTVRPIP